MTLQEILASILNPNAGQQNQLSTAGAPAQVGDHANPAALMQGQLPQQAQQHAFSLPQAPQGQPMPQSAPQPAMGQAPAPEMASPGGGGIGGFLSNLLNPQAAQKNHTIGWLQKQGLDQGTATLLAGSKPALQQYLLSRSEGKKPIEVNGRLVDPDTYQVLADFSDGGSKLQSVGKDSALYDPATKTWITPPRTDNGGQFEGTSVEAQSLNHLVKTGQLTQDQAAQLGAGKTITNPADGSITFLTPQGVFGQPANGGPPQPLTPQPGGGGEATPAPNASGRPGIIPLTEGKPGKLATEGERRNRSLYSVVEPELKIVEGNFDALSDIENQAYSRLPFSEYMTTPEYQQAANSLQTIVSSYLYSVSGATATPDEVKKQTDILTPRPGESKVSIENKKRRVRQMVDSIRQSGGQWEPSRDGGDGGAGAQQPKTMPNVGESRYGYRFKGGDPSEPSNWEKAN
ncbi:MAG: hypothetical protein E5Y67_12350 [Mesorhizobium sp.]|uniref:hypothetical protein n=1 Tax=Mesorhizobium sp. TaxID=1871066 RepID=UPI00120D5FDE|nr:hypothetical protein [Mesorhizobium sp.]TIM14463.1 MAG: hypothetical protein E5Y67_12350 [Mesorhizobium sp.]